MTTEHDLEAKVCVITGAGRGIGAATAVRFAQSGARIAILDRDRTLGLKARRRSNAKVQMCGSTRLTCPMRTA